MRKITINFEDGSVHTITEREIMENYATKTCRKNGWDVHSPAWYELARSSSAVDSFLEEQVKEQYEHFFPAIETINLL